MKIFLWILVLPIVFISQSGCAILHHVNVGEVDGRILKTGQRFEILVSETGININEAGDVAKVLSNNRETSKEIQQIQDIISLFQMGPRTGNMVFNDTYADTLAADILKKCPNGEISSITVIREMRKYPVVSGEIVKLVGYCLKRRKRV